MESDSISDDDVIIIDTDSRSVTPEEAYRKVKEAAGYLKSQPYDIIFKKIDSTLRGNIGAEFDALYDVFQPDFIVCTPAYPDYNRKVRDGCLYLGDKLLHETEFALDPKTPIRESNIPKMINGQSQRGVGLITITDLALGEEHLKQKLLGFHRNNMKYLIFDAVSEQDLQQVVQLFADNAYEIIWSGSAGLANCLTVPGKRREVALAKSEHPVLIVVGSVNKNTRKQLELLLSEPDVKGVRMESHHVVSDDERLEAEVSRVHAEAREGIRKGQHIVLYSSGGPDEIKLANQVGGSYGLSPTAVSDKISEVLGQSAARLLQMSAINRLILTGGDTAKQFCRFSRLEKFELIDEVETGVPIGIFSGDKEIYGVTKAGGFGSDAVLICSLKILQGEKTICVQ